MRKRHKNLTMLGHGVGNFKKKSGQKKKGGG